MEITFINLHENNLYLIHQTKGILNEENSFLIRHAFCLYSLIACSDPALGSNTRYKLYPTKNMWTFLKLDTETGKIWQVHFSVDGKDSRFEIPLNSSDIAQTLKKSKKNWTIRTIPNTKYV
jgi:hypothetical protein